MIKKNIAKFIPTNFLKIYLTIKHVISNYKNISKFAELERKVNKNVELNDIEFEEFEEFLSSIPENFQTYVDIGAADGVNASCTLKLAKDKKWSGVCFEFGDISNISYIYRNFENVNICKVKIVPDNIANLLKSYNIPKYFGFLNLDIDSYDYFVLEELLNDFKFQFLILEINPIFPLSVDFAVEFDKKFQWGGNSFQGASISMFYKLLDKNNYSIIWIDRSFVLALNNSYINNEIQIIELNQIDNVLNRSLEVYNKSFWQKYGEYRRLKPEEIIAKAKNDFKKYKNYHLEKSSF